MLKWKPSGILFFASLIMMAQGGAWAQQEMPVIPEIQVDGSVLQQLATPSVDDTPAPDLAPVKLIPPTLNRTAVPATGSLTMFESDPATPPARTENIKPIITMTKAPKAEPPKTLVKKTEAPLPAHKPQIAVSDTVVAFPVQEKTKKSGGLNPASAKTAAAPVQPDSKTIEALGQSMTQRDLPASPPAAQAQTKVDMADSSWRQQDPKHLYDNIPIPKSRPAIGMASASFVQQARANLVDTYTIVKREGDKMPAVPKQKVAGEKLPAPRLSIADIAGDPLASRIVDMTPEEVAQALNAMAPASGQEKMHLSRELSAVAKPRIVRERGEWIRKDGKSTRHEGDSSLVDKTASPSNKKENAREIDLIAASASATLPFPPKTPIARRPETRAASAPESEISSGTISVAFKAGEVSLTGEATGTIDKNVVDALKTSPDARIQIVAYAAATDGKESTARRTSLSRALSVRSYLISQGIDATRMDVRAMGIQADQKAEADKVDMVLVPGKKS